MTHKRVAASLYVASALLGPACLWLFAQPDERFTSYLVIYEVLPLGSIALCLAVTRRGSVAPIVLDVVTALLWVTMHVLLLFTSGFTRPTPPLTPALANTTALLVGSVAVCLGGLSFAAITSSWRKGLLSGSGQLLVALGTGLLALYLARGTLLYAGVLTTARDGLAGISREMTLRLLATLVVVFALGSGALVDGRHRRRTA